jgi:hypothetical protein
MEGATHFIEQYRYGSMLFDSPIEEIEKLKYYIETTKTLNHTTVAVFKIKFKHNAHNLPVSHAQSGTLPAAHEASNND